TVRRLACDARLTRAIVDASGMPLDIGRTTRAWTVVQHTAAEQLFGGCAFPIADRSPCGRPIGWTDLHHVIWWRHDGPTDQDNGVSLCRHHHNAVHHDGWQLAFDLPTGTVTVQRTEGGRTVRRRARFPQDNPRRSLEQDDPDRPDPDRPDPDRPDPDRAGPDRAGPGRAGPVRGGPDRSGPEWSDPGRADPDRSDRDGDGPGDGRLPI
ncbi:MAG: HNH endonuclease signature motif containing protein, partial [Actinomycetota bacterium]